MMGSREGAPTTTPEMTEARASVPQSYGDNDAARMLGSVISEGRAGGDSGPKGREAGQGAIAPP